MIQIERQILLQWFKCFVLLLGTSANTLNFQLYLLEGLNRWNQDRGTAAVTSKTRYGSLCQNQQPEGVWPGFCANFHATCQIHWYVLPLSG